MDKIKYTKLAGEELTWQCGTCLYLKNVKDERHISLCINKDAPYYNIPLRHSRPRIACNLYKVGREMDNASLLVEPEKMKFVEDYRNKYKGKEIWVIGLDPFLDDYPDDFFDDKISIATSCSFMAFPKCTYIINSHEEYTKWIMKNKPRFLEKCILCIFPFKNEGLTWPDKYGYKPIWMMISNPSVRKRSLEDAEKACWSMAKSIVNKQQVTYIAHWSIAHMGILAAIILGAKKVTLAGCSGMARKFQGHAARAGMLKFCVPEERDMERKGVQFSEACMKGEVEPVIKWRRGTSLFAEIFGQYGIEICKHWYKRGYEKIEPFSYWLDRDKMGS